MIRVLLNKPGEQITRITLEYFPDDSDLHELLTDRKGKLNKVSQTNRVRLPKGGELQVASAPNSTEHSTGYSRSRLKAFEAKMIDELIAVRAAMDEAIGDTTLPADNDDPPF